MFCLMKKSDFVHPFIDDQFVSWELLVRLLKIHFSFQTSWRRLKSVELTLLHYICSGVLEADDLSNFKGVSIYSQRVLPFYSLVPGKQFGPFIRLNFFGPSSLKTKQTKFIKIHQSDHVLCVVINIATGNMTNICWEFRKQTHRQTKLRGFRTEIEFAQIRLKSESGCLG